MHKTRRCAIHTEYISSSLTSLTKSFLLRYRWNGANNQHSLFSAFRIFYSSTLDKSAKVNICMFSIQNSDVCESHKNCICFHFLFHFCSSFLRFHFCSTKKKNRILCLAFHVHSVRTIGNEVFNFKNADIRSKL